MQTAIRRGALVRWLAVGLLSAAAGAPAQDFIFSERFPNPSFDFEFPTGLEVDDEGNVFIADRDVVYKFSPGGELLLTYGPGTTTQLNTPYGLDLRDNGWLYVANTLLHNVVIFRTDGSVERVLGSFGTNDGEFFRVYDVEYDDTHVFITDFFNDRVQVLDSEGVFLWSWGTSGTATGEFDGPTGITADKEGFIYVADNGNDRVQKFEPDGTFVASWDTISYEGVTYTEPLLLKTDKADQIYVPYQSPNAVVILDGDGPAVSIINNFGEAGAPFGMPGAAIRDPIGRIYISDVEEEIVMAYAPASEADSDGDGMGDAYEGMGDADGDGVPRYVDGDSDGDGLTDLQEGNGDADGDFLRNYVDTESDGDGVSDRDERYNGTDPYDVGNLQPVPVAFLGIGLALLGMGGLVLRHKR